MCVALADRVLGLLRGLCVKYTTITLGVKFKLKVSFDFPNLFSYKMSWQNVQQLSEAFTSWPRRIVTSIKEKLCFKLCFRVQETTLYDYKSWQEAAQSRNTLPDWAELTPLPPRTPPLAVTPLVNPGRVEQHRRTPAPANFSKRSPYSGTQQRPSSSVPNIESRQ